MIHVEIASIVIKQHELTRMKKQTERETQLKRMLKVKNVKVGKIWRNKNNGKTSKRSIRQGTK